MKRLLSVLDWVLLLLMGISALLLFWGGSLLLKLLGEEVDWE